ncbi:uncharacterized protein LOC124271827 isoform X3 [Haliotis rubra]|uniref:uncharacterized protein LOC124271827 isoform X3 n=1 Tax=Haliotis rubra TaxID=36100 RepID=UPI001EE5E866|nr:uncharacterized protein LOC124271827 isoform X3 [Haliotis rubra]XP_046562933.1 uncharacterized protein LOC124271827 isoform X3 [Haliotis rubra]
MTRLKPLSPNMTPMVMVFWDDDEMSTLNLDTLKAAADADSDGEVTRDEFNDVFTKMDINGNDSLYVGEVYAYLKHNNFI